MYFFDVCGTLYKENTTFSFIKYYHLQKRNWLRFVFVLFCLSLFGKILNRFFGVSIRYWLIGTLKGAPCKDLQETADNYVGEILKSKEVSAVFSVFSNLVSNSPEKVFLVSASIDPVIQAIARIYKVKFYSSEIEYMDGVSTGRLASDLKGNKEEVLEMHSTHASFFYTDNIDDIPCAKLVDKLYFIVKKTKRVASIKLPDNVGMIYV